MADCVDAVDVQLFRVALDQSGAGIVGLRLHSGFRAEDADLSMLHRFQFRLLSSGVQDGMKQGQIVKIPGRSTKGGRLLTALLHRMDCEAYYLCPLFVNGELRGMLGIAWQRQIDRDSEQAAELFELLKLNGLILLVGLIRVRRETVRRRKLKAWRRLADQACDFAVTIDRNYVIRNTVVFGSGPATPQLDGLRLIDLVTRSCYRDLDRQIESAVRTSEVRTIDFQLILGHEGPRWYLARIEPSGRSSDIHVTLYLTDNHPDKVLEEQVRELSDGLLKASRLSLLGQMSTEFAHQLNQPLQAILNYCNLMQRRIGKQSDTPDGNLTTLQNIETSVQHAANIIQRVRDFVKFRSLSTEVLQIGDLIDQASLMVLPTARGWNVEIVPQLNMASCEVVADRSQTTHVLVNLMMNALEACRDCGIERPRVEISVSVDSHRGRVVVAVKDNGPGLPKQDPDIVFRKFYTGREDGLGMGLAISRDVCESQGGSLTATNNIDEPGCTFFVTMVLNPAIESETVEL
ncbi:MAG: ATP-binding protein [Planctomycetaceae bacterium]